MQFGLDSKGQGGLNTDLLYTSQDLIQVNIKIPRVPEQKVDYLKMELHCKYFYFLCLHKSQNTNFFLQLPIVPHCSISQYH